MSHSIENKYIGELRTQSTHLKSSDVILTDAPVDNNGKGDAFSPTDLVASALCSCMTTVMGICAEKNNFELCSEVVRPLKSKNPLMQPFLWGMRKSASTQTWSMGSVFIYSPKSDAN